MKELLKDVSCIVLIVLLVCTMVIAPYVVIKSIETTDTTELDFDVYEMEYEGHTYYVFSEQGTTISVLHSPDCDVCKE